MLNDLGIDPYEWFDNPLDSMPIATYVENDGSTGPLIPPPYKRKDPPAELMEVPTSVKNPKFKKKKVEAELSLHEKMYRYATNKYNPFSVGGSESIHDFE